MTTATDTLSGKVLIVDDMPANVLLLERMLRALASMLGMDEEFIERIYFASPMHDIGKIGIPDNVLLKSGSFTPEEAEVMKGHTSMGAKILGNSNSRYLQMGPPQDATACPVN